MPIGNFTTIGVSEANVPIKPQGMVYAPTRPTTTKEDLAAHPRQAALRTPQSVNLGLVGDSPNIMGTLATLATYGLAGAAGVWLALSKAPSDKQWVYGGIGAVGGMICVPIVKWVMKRFM